MNRRRQQPVAASVEARVPFLETDLIDFGLHLAPAAKYHRRQVKRVVKAAAAGLLPENIIHAKKIGFPMPSRFMTGYAGLLDGGIVPDLFKWRARETDRLHEVMRANPVLGRQVVGMELWAQLYFNGATPDELGERLRAVRVPAEQ